MRDAGPRPGVSSKSVAVLRCGDYSAGTATKTVLLPSVCLHMPATKPESLMALGQQAHDARRLLHSWLDQRLGAPQVHFDSHLTWFRNRGRATRMALDYGNLEGVAFRWERRALLASTGRQGDSP